ncbi:hypothetical protein BGZ65_011755, partial [Modicella reniformis]
LVHRKKKKNEGEDIVSEGQPRPATTASSTARKARYITAAIPNREDCMRNSKYRDRCHSRFARSRQGMESIGSQRIPYMEQRPIWKDAAERKQDKRFNTSEGMLSVNNLEVQIIPIRHEDPAEAKDHQFNNMKESFQEH